MRSPVPSRVSPLRADMYSSKIGTWYELWYPKIGAAGQASWNTGRFVPDLGKYSSDDSAIYESHRMMLKESAIDFIIVDATNDIDTADVFKNLIKLFDFMDAIQPHDRIEIAIGIGSWFQNANPTAEANRIWNEFAQRPSYFHVEGHVEGHVERKPLIVNYANSSAGWKWDHPRFFVGLHWGHISEFLRQNTGPDARSRCKNRGIWGWVADSAPLKNRMEMHTIPGWSRRHLGDTRSPIPRGEHGETLQNQLLDAIAEDPQHITIGCFNDFTEETSLEPAIFDPSLPLSDHSGAYAYDYNGHETSDWYWQIARAYSLLRWGLEEGAFYRDLDRRDVYSVENGKLVYRGKPANHKAIIHLPVGTLRAILNNHIAKFTIKNTHSLINMAGSAQWRDNHGSRNFGQQTPQRGSVRKINSPKLQSGNTFDTGLFTHPAWQTDGFIEGRFSFNIPMHKHTYLTTSVGLLHSAERSNGVQFEIHVGHQHAFIPVRFDGGICKDIVLDLSPAAGHGEVILKVTTMGNSHSDHAVWIDPKLIVCE